VELSDDECIRLATQTLADGSMNELDRAERLELIGVYHCARHEKTGMKSGLKDVICKAGT
jgi:hypothetical protein